jgi:hypothetical protein
MGLMLTVPAALPRTRVPQSIRIQPPKPRDDAAATSTGGMVRGIVRRSMTWLSAMVFTLLFPAMVLWGGSNHLINWGPGLLLAGAACLLLISGKSRPVRDGFFHSWGFLLLLGLLFLRARYSPDESSAANNSTLIALAAAGFLIGSVAGSVQSRALFAGLSLTAMLNLYCTIMQVGNVEWNLVYPQRSAGLPSGLFAHYSYSAAFCLGAVGLLVSHSRMEHSWLRAVMIGGAACALVTIPLSPSRSGNLALSLLVASTGALLLARAFANSRTVMSIWLPSIALVIMVLIFASAFVPLIDRGSGPHGFYGDDVRLEYGNAAMQLAAGSPWLGDGAGSFAWNVFQVLGGLTTEPGLVHNEALQMAADYGYPALAAISLLLLVPAALCCWRFVNKTDATATAIAALGLVAMLFQSNFESIFHSAPGAFIAALVLGQINRSFSGNHKNARAESSAGSHGGKDVATGFPAAIVECIEECRTGDHQAVAKLVGLLSQSKDDHWWRSACRLTYWTKVRDEEALREAVMRIGVEARAELERASLSGHPLHDKSAATNPSRLRHILRNTALAAFAIFILMSGARLSHALADGWDPLYQPEQMSASQGFNRLIQLAGRYPGLGIDRKVLSAAVDCIHQYDAQEARERWAQNHRPKLLLAVHGWRKDPGAALQMAEITGWAGDFEAALNFYDHAIATQGKNEILFMARAFKGQYFHELCISAAAAGQGDRQRHFSGLAVECFQGAIDAMGKQGRLHSEFARMMRECQAVQGTGPD